MSVVQGEHYNQLLENERRMVVGLRSSLAAKERELTETVDRVLQEKVALAKVQGELAALRARCHTDQQHITSLQSKLSSLRAEGESRAGEETVRQLEVDQLRRQLHQLQATSEKQRETVSEAQREKQQLQATVSGLQTQITSLQKKTSRDREEVARLSEALANKEEEVAGLEEQLITLGSSPSHPTLPLDLLQAKLMRLYARYREAEVHRKALVFQKNYLKCQVDAFFQTQQAALIMMAEMGAPPATTNTRKYKSRGLRRMKTAVHVVMAAFRFQYVVRRRNQYIRSYSNRVEREKTAALTTRGHTSDGIRPATGIDAILGSYKPPSRPPTTRTAQAFPPPTTTTPGLRQSKRATPVSSSTKHAPHNYTSSQPTPQTEPSHPSTFIPSLARLQAKLNGAVH
jgi:predicted nuclease with TOPRIM domain